MARAAAVLCALCCAACTDNPYVIGRAERDAGARDAGARDAGRDAGVDAGPDECSGEHAGALACSGFESADLRVDWDDVIEQVGGELERTSARAHGGGAALHASSAAMESVAIVTKTFGPVLAGDVYLRLYLYVPGGLPTRTMNIMFIGDDPYPDPFIGIDVNLAAGGELQVFSPQATPARQTGATAVPRDRWFCLRAHVVVADEGVVQLFVDDALALEATSIDTLPAEGIRELRLGIDWSSEQADFFELYADDVVLDLAPVSC